MMEVVRITIKGTSGYGPYDEAYEDKVTISPDSIRYEYVPMVQSPENMLRKWSYKTTNPAFSKLFWHAAAAVEEILDQEEKGLVLDIGEIVFTVRYSDKTRRSREFFLPADDFKECFSIIKRMIPACEDIPFVLQTSEDR